MMNGAREETVTGNVRFTRLAVTFFDEFMVIVTTGFVLLTSPDQCENI